MDEAGALAERVVRRLAQRGLTLAAAESCTGGLVGHLITDVTGSSACWLGGVTPYATSMKTRLLGVPDETLRAHGSVSAETAMSMALGVRALYEADIGVAVTGIAGPSGGTSAKPVGLVYLALAGPEGRSLAQRAVWDGDRRANKLRSAEAALRLIERYLDAEQQRGRIAS